MTNLNDGRQTIWLAQFVGSCLLMCFHFSIYILLFFRFSFLTQNTENIMINIDADIAVFFICLWTAQKIEKKNNSSWILL
jgi:hypothetical protein